MKILIGLLSIILFTSASSWESWPENINDLIRYQRDEKLGFKAANIRYLSSEWLNRLSAVKFLTFRNGNIEKIYVKPELQRLELSYTNTEELEINPKESYQTCRLKIVGGSLKTVPRNLHRLTNLTELDLSINQIESVNMDEFIGLENLRVLDLSWNRIIKIHATIEINFPNLEELYLNRNNLPMFEMCGWKLPKLRSIQLGWNRLSHVVLNSWEYPKLIRIYLSGNAVNCAWLRKFREKNVETDVCMVEEDCPEYHTNTSFPIDCGNIDGSQCGQRQKKDVTPIVNEQNTDRGSWPWHAAVYRKIKNRMEYACGGTLISRRFVLSAAHCVASVDTRRASPSQMLEVKLGMHTLDRVDSDIQQFWVMRIFIPENFNQLENDISLLRLSRDAVFDAFVQPICINLSGDLIGQYGTVVGWGLQNDKGQVSVLQSFQMTVCESSHCLLGSREENGVVCAENLNGSSICNGGIGGGLLFQRNNIWYIGGIFAFGANRFANDGLCKTGEYSAFTDVAQHGEWISKTIVP